MSDSKKAGPNSRHHSKNRSRPEASRREEEMNPPTTVGETDYRDEAAPVSEAEAYTLQVFWEPDQDVFSATFLEFPELVATDVSRQEAIYLAEDKLHSHLAALRQSGRPVPAPIRVQKVPSKLEIPVSQTLYRKLEMRRHQERVSLEQLITELLTSAVERKAPESERGGERSGGGRDHGRRGGQHGGKGQRQQSQRGGGGGRRGGYHETMDSRENFMEYVRNLEKGGYKKR